MNVTITTYADGYGIWYAKVSGENLDVAMATQFADSAITNEIESRGDRNVFGIELHDTLINSQGYIFKER